MHDKFHWNCCCRRLLGALLWTLSLLALVFAWIAFWRPNNVFLGFPIAHWYWDALVLGVLAIPLKSKRGHHGLGGSCEHCGHEKQ